MIYQSLVITILLFFMIMAFMRIKRRVWAGATLPLAVIPCVNCVCYFIVSFVMGLEYNFYFASLVVLIALAISCTWIGFYCAMALPKKKAKTLYMNITIFFDLVLSAILIYDYYETLVVAATP